MPDESVICADCNRTPSARFRCPLILVCLGPDGADVLCPGDLGRPIDWRALRRAMWWPRGVRLSLAARMIVGVIG